jgi:hypothetical protein
MSFLEEIKRPFNLFTLLLAIIGIILSIFFYYKSEKVKGISYIIDEPPSLIFDSKNSSSAIKVIEHDSVNINGDVYLLTGSLWNSGDYPISKEDIRLPISLSLGNDNRILDFKITYQKVPNIADFVLIKENPNSLNLGWKYFDPGFGFKFQIMYVGSNISNFEINGNILDIKEFRKREKIEQKNDFIKWYLLLAPVGILIISILRFFSHKRNSNQYHKGYLVFIIISLLMLLVSIWIYYINQTTAPI